MTGVDPVLFGAGCLILGIIIGILFYREVLNWSHRNSDLRIEPCSICSRTGVAHKCTRCKKDVAMCHGYYIRLTGNPSPTAVAPPPNWHICSECLTDDERRFLEGRGHFRLGQ